MNLFCCNSALPIITASALMLKKYHNEVNILVIERSHKTIYSRIAIEKYITDSVKWSHIYIIEVNAKYVKFSDFMLNPKFLPHGIWIVKNRKLAVEKFNNILKSHGDINRYFFSDNSILLKYVYSRNMGNISYIEHGASSYRLSKGKSKGKVKKYLKKIYIFLVSAVEVPLRDRIYLSDGGQSESVRNYRDRSSQIKPISLDLSKEIKYIYLKFMEKFSIKSSGAYAEIVTIRDNSFDRKLYLYLPTDAVSQDEYLDYLKEQVKYIKVKNPLFIIKKHPSAPKKNYKTFFSETGLDCCNFKNDIILHIPAEFLILFFDNATLFGSYSSSHLYVKWWFGKKTVLSEVINSDINKILRHEYHATLNDFY
jgi:hypothetical protein